MNTKRKSNDSVLGIIDINDIQKKKLKQMKEEKEEEDEQNVVIETKAAALPFLDDAVYVEILYRIPATTLYKKFRYICKTWHNIITNPIPTFIQQNLLCSDPAGLIITDLFQDSVIINKEPRISHRTYFIKVTEGSYEERDLTKWFEEYVIQAYCNGLLLLTDRRCPNLHYYVANPLMKKLVMLPPCASFCLKPEFLFNPSTGEYKVMVPMTKIVGTHIFLNGVGIHIELNGYEILTLGGCFEKDLRWRQVQGPPILYYTRHLPVTVNGVLHVFDLPHKILSFDISTEVFHEMHLSDFHTTCGFRFLDIGCFLAFMEPVVSRNQFDVWILKDFRTGEWIKQQSINMRIEGTKSFCKKYERVVPVMSLGNNGEIIIFGKQEGYGAARLKAYNVKLKKWWKVGSKRFSIVTASFGRHEHKLVSMKDLIRRH